MSETAVTPRRGLALPYPMAPDFMAQVVVPRDMTDHEARKLCAFVMTLATPTPTPAPPGEPNKEEERT